MATDTNPEFEKFWERYGNLLRVSASVGEAKQAFRAAFVSGELAEMEGQAQRAGREAHSRGCEKPPTATAPA